MKFYEKKPSTYIIKDLEKVEFWENYMKKSFKNVQFKVKPFFILNFYRSVVMNSFSIEQVFNASFNCYPNNSLSSFTKFLPEQIHLKGELEVAISEISYSSLYQNVTEGKLFFHRWTRKS